MLSVGADRYQAVPIRAQDFRVMLAESFEHVAVGMAVAVVESHRNDGESRIGGDQKTLRAGRAAAVVGHFEDVRGSDLVFLEHAAFDVPRSEEETEELQS